MRCLKWRGKEGNEGEEIFYNPRSIGEKMDFVKLHEEFTKKANDALPYLLELLKSKDEVPVSLRVFKDDFRKQLFEMIKRGGLKSPKLKPKSKNHFFLEFFRFYLVQVWFLPLLVQNAQALIRIFFLLQNIGTYDGLRNHLQADLGLFLIPSPQRIQYGNHELLFDIIIIRFCETFLLAK